MLVAYLVFFLSGLANGLTSLNREVVDKWDASVIVLTEESDKSLVASTMTIDEAEAVNADETAVPGQKLYRLRLQKRYTATPRLF